MASLTLFWIVLALRTNAHVFVGNPSPFRGSGDINKLIMPMNGDKNSGTGPEWGQQPFPCKGFHTDLPHIEPSVIWNVGEEVTFQLFDSNNVTGPGMHDPGAAHGGGSCQISFSYDQGKQWIAVQSWEGNCPRVRKGEEGQITNRYDINQDYSFRVPEHFPSGDKVIVSWTWLNAVGQREFYMSCFLVQIRGGNNSTQHPQGSPMLIANLKAKPHDTEVEDQIWSRCNTAEQLWIRYPERNRGVYPPIIADSPPNGSPIKFSDFDDPEGYCGSDNKELVEALALGSPLPMGETPLPSKGSPAVSTSQAEYQHGPSGSAVLTPPCPHQNQASSIIQ